jgi:hypothetical protein
MQQQGHNPLRLPTQMFELDIELDGYLAVWQAMHPECSTERLTPLANG